MRPGPPSVPSRIPSTFARPSSTCCHCTCRPMSRKVSRMSSAIASSDPVKLGVPIARDAHSMMRVSSILSSVTDVWKHLLAEEADLVVAPVAPELEHDVGAARVAVLVDRLDAVRRRPSDRLALVEDRVGHLRLRRKSAALLHRLCNRPDLVLFEVSEVKQRVGGALDVLHLVREVHAGDLARTVAT